MLKRGGSAVYRCRMCRKEFEAWGGGGDMGALLAGITGQLRMEDALKLAGWSPQNAATLGPKDMLTTHSCDENRVGVADLVGGRLG